MTPESMGEAMKEVSIKYERQYTYIRVFFPQNIELRIKCQTLDVERENIQSLLFDAQLAIEALQGKLNELLLNEQDWSREKQGLLEKIEMLSSRLSELDMLQNEIESIKKK